MAARLTSGFLAIVICSLVSRSWAASPAFTNLSRSDLNKIASDVGAVFAHTSVSPAASTAQVFGVEMGLLAGAAAVPGIEDLSKRVDPDSELTALPQLGLLGAVTIPFGVKAEIIYLPELEASGVTLNYESMALQWTMTHMLMELPFDLALKVFSTKGTIGYSQDVSGTNTKVDINEKVSGVQIIGGKNYVVLEPYGGFGFVNAEGEIDIHGTNEFFNFTTSQKASETRSGTQFFVGINLNLAVIRVGLEAGQVFDSTKVAGKFTLNF